MSNNLQNIFTNIANAIRNKKGTNTTIKPVNMSNEILSISTGTDTSDATATVNDILLGKTAYVNGNKIEGNILSYDGGCEEGIEITGDTSDATATSNDILLGKTAYVKGNKIEGNIVSYDGSYENGIKVVAGDSNIINVDEFPTENIDEEKIYKKEDRINVDIILFFQGNMTNLSQLMGKIEYYFVDSFPENPNIFNPDTGITYCYIMNDIGYIYASPDGTSSPAWYTIADIFAADGIQLENKGYIANRTLITEEGIYVTYSDSVIYGIKDKYVYQYNNYLNEWTDVNSQFDAFFNKTITYFDCSRYNTIPPYGFYGASELSNLINTESIQLIGEYAFENCRSLTSVSFPNLLQIGGRYTFDGCYNLKKVDLGTLREILGANYIFSFCKSLTKIIFRYTEGVCTTTGTSGIVNDWCYHFTGTVDSEYNPNGLKDGKIYVPDTLVDSYKTNTYWSKYAEFIVGLSELQEE